MYIYIIDTCIYIYIHVHMCINICIHVYTYHRYMYIYICIIDTCIYYVHICVFAALSTVLLPLIGVCCTYILVLKYMCGTFGILKNSLKNAQYEGI